MRSMETEHPLKIYRVKNKLTQGQLAQILGVSDATITHIENGRRPVTPKNALDWERKIGLTKEALCPDIFGREIVGAGDTASEVHQGEL
jgi:DNA-binding XRE family transcriptional regulator